MKPRQLIQAMAVAAIASALLTACQREAGALDNLLTQLGPVASASYLR